MQPRDNRATVRRRTDYRPPAFLVDRISLEFDLDPDATRVTSTLNFRRNPDADPRDRDAPLALDGEGLADVAALLDGVPLPNTRVVQSPGRLSIADLPAAGTLTVHTRIAPARNSAL